MLSYNNNAYPSKEEIINIISKYSTEIKIFEKQHNYQVTSATKKKNNIEYLFVVKI